MKRIILLLMAVSLLQLTSCSRTGQPKDEPAVESTTIETEPQENSAGEIWTRSDMPSHLRYDRMWEYSDHAETDDPGQIEAIVDAIRNMTVKDPVQYAVDDYTDILTFGFADGTTLRVEFEEQNWVRDGKERYHVEGLGVLRSLLEGMMDNAGSKSDSGSEAYEYTEYPLERNGISLHLDCMKMGGRQPENNILAGARGVCGLAAGHRGVWTVRRSRGRPDAGYGLCSGGYPGGDGTDRERDRAGEDRPAWLELGNDDDGALRR